MLVWHTMLNVKVKFVVRVLGRLELHVILGCLFLLSVGSPLERAVGLIELHHMRLIVAIVIAAATVIIIQDALIDDFVRLQ